MVVMIAWRRDRMIARWRRTIMMIVRKAIKVTIGPIMIVMIVIVVGIVMIVVSMMEMRWRRLISVIGKLRRTIIVHSVLWRRRPSSDSTTSWITTIILVQPSPTTRRRWFIPVRGRTSRRTILQMTMRKWRFILWRTVVGMSWSMVMIATWWWRRIIVIVVVSHRRMRWIVRRKIVAFLLSSKSFFS